jgi:hypothetical protein
MMQRVFCSFAFVWLLGFAAFDNRTSILEAAATFADSPHAYFDALVARPEHWRSFSLRDQRQLETRANGGYANSNDTPLYVTYSPETDPDPRRQDAAKVVIPAGRPSLPNQVRFPMDTTDGTAYFVTWDAWFGAEFHISTAGIPQQKTFQFSSDGIWFEVQSRFNLNQGGLAQVTTRGYAGGNARGDNPPFGPNVTDTNPLPQVGTFSIKAERWTRYWAVIDQRANDFDLASLWVADETTGPVQLLDRIQLDAINGKIDQFYLEYNTSTSPPEGRGPLVAYVRNLVMMRNVVNPTGLMQRPNAGGALPPPIVLPPGSGTTAPSAPRNLRIIPPPL